MPTRRTSRGAKRTVAVVAALCAAAVTLPGVAAAQDGEEPREPAPYEVSGDAEAIKGANSSTDAPKLADPGYFTDSIGRGEEKYYRVDLDASSTAYLSALAHPEVGSKVGTVDRLRLELLSTGGDKCSTNTAGFTNVQVAHPIGNMVSRRIGADENCQTAGPYLLKVAREDKPASDPADWPIEIRYMLEPGLRGSLPAPPAEGSWSIDPPSPPSGEATRIEGGNGITTAPAVGDGVWRDRVMPGETRFYRVPLDWGQQLFAQGELPDAADKESRGRFLSRAFAMNLYSPTGAGIVSKNFQTYKGEQTAGVLGSRPVHYGNRFDREGKAISTAGFYTIAFTASPDLVGYFPNGVNLTLRVKIRGEAEEAPDYDGDAEAAGLAVSDEDREAAQRGVVSTGADDSGDQMRLLGVTGIGVGTALIVGLGLWTLLGRRRAGSPVAPASATGYPQQRDERNGWPTTP